MDKIVYDAINNLKTLCEAHNGMVLFTDHKTFDYTEIPEKIEFLKSIISKNDVCKITNRINKLSECFDKKVGYESILIQVCFTKNNIDAKKTLAIVKSYYGIDENIKMLTNAEKELKAFFVENV